MMLAPGVKAGIYLRQLRPGRRANGLNAPQKHLRKETIQGQLLSENCSSCQSPFFGL